MRGANFVAVVAALSLVAGGAQAAAPIAARMITGTPPELPQAAREIGAQGIVIVGATVGTDGAVRNAKVVKGTGSDLVDQAAVTALAAAVYEPARDADGNPVEQSIQIKIYMLKDSIGDPEHDLTLKTCADFVLDVDWFTRTHPGEGMIEMPLYAIMTGVFALGNSRGDPQGMLATVGRLKVAWPQTYKDCLKKPDKPFFEMLKKRMR